MLSIENLQKTYPNGVCALGGISLNIPAGMFGLLGPNGAGKSSLMRTLSTLQQPDSGKITFDGIDVLHEPQELRQRLGYLPQEFGVYPGVSAWELLNHFAALKGIPGKDRKKVCEDLLKLVNLYDARGRAVSTYSGGMRQRFGIAQALLGDPKLIIVDEPTAGLDPEERRRFNNLLSEVGQSVAVILSTHIVEDVQDLCPQLAIMVKGEIRVSGSSEEIIDKLAGRVWSKEINHQELPDYEAKHNVLLNRLKLDETTIVVYAENRPDDSFQSIDPVIEHVYFATLKGFI